MSKAHKPCHLCKKVAELRPYGPRGAMICSQAQAAEMTRAALRTWEHWEAGERRMPAAAMELFCIALAVGTVERGPYVPPGDWMRPWVRDELALWFRRPAPLAPPMCRR